MLYGTYNVDFATDKDREDRTLTITENGAVIGQIPESKMELSYPELIELFDRMKSGLLR